MSEFPGSIPESSIPVRPTGLSHLSGDYHTSRPWHYTGEPILTALEFEPAISAENDDMYYFNDDNSSEDSTSGWSLDSFPGWAWFLACCGFLLTVALVTLILLLIYRRNAQQPVIILKPSRILRLEHFRYASRRLFHGCPVEGDCNQGQCVNACVHEEQVCDVEHQGAVMRNMVQVDLSGMTTKKTLPEVHKSCSFEQLDEHNSSLRKKQMTYDVNNKHRSWDSKPT